MSDVSQNLLLWSSDFLNVGLRNGNEVETENGRAWARFNGITTKTEVSFIQKI